MRGPRSLQLRLSLALGLTVTIMWIAAAAITGRHLALEMETVFDGAMRETAFRLLPLASRGGDARGMLERERGRGRGSDDGWDDDGDDGRDGDDDEDRREDRDDDHRDGGSLLDQFTKLPNPEGSYSYVLFDRSGAVILSSQDADVAQFPAFEAEGFRQVGDYRLFYDQADREGLVIAVAQPLAYREAVARSLALGLSFPLLVVIPLSFGLIFLVLRRSLAPVRKLRDDLGERSAQNLAALDDRGLPSELSPVVGSLNGLFARLSAAFEAERSFAANAAHELRTPVAGAIAQAQRLKAETGDDAAAARAGEIEATLKRLNSLSEKLMQLARAEGARLRTGVATDMRPILRLVAEDFERLGAEGRLDVALPDRPVMSDLDPDAFGILIRNLIENALKHGGDGKVEITLTDAGVLSVANGGPVIAPEELGRLTGRFTRANGKVDGSGLGLAIVRTIAERAEASLAIVSPASAREDGFEVRVSLPKPA